MSILKKKNLATAIGAGLLAFGMSEGALADAYAVSYNNIFNFNIAGLDDPDIDQGSLSFTTNSSSGATFGGSDPSFSDVLDALLSFEPGPTAPPPPGNNSFTTLGGFGTLDYGLGDAVIDTTPPAANGQARNIAEASTTVPGAAGEATGTGGNSLVVEGILNIEGDAELTFTFDAAPYSFAEADPFGSATADLDFGITITDPTGATVYSFAPSVLNVDIAAIGDDVTGDTSFHNPAGYAVDGQGYVGAGFAFDQSPDNFLSFTDMTPVFTIPGEYSLVVNVQEGVSVSQRQPSSNPEPGTLVLLGGGLAGLSLIRRRRRKSA